MTNTKRNSCMCYEHGIKWDGWQCLMLFRDYIDYIALRIQWGKFLSQWNQWEVNH